jgi:glutathione peroxidase
MRNKRLPLLLLLVISVVQLRAQSIHSLTIQSIDNTPINLSSYQGEKLMFIVLPHNMSDFVISELDSFISTYGNKVKVIGCFSYESGFADSSKADIKNYFQAKGINIILSGGYYTETSSGTNQSPLFQWLSKKTLNGKISTNIKTGSYKFFVSSAGELYAAMQPHIGLLSGSIVNSINRQL